MFIDSGWLFINIQKHSQVVTYVRNSLRSNDIQDKIIFTGLTTSLRQLEGLALVDRSSSSDAISYFPVTNLPLDIQDRFNTLFATRDKWTFEEIRPYIE